MMTDVRETLTNRNYCFEDVWKLAKEVEKFA